MMMSMYQSRDQNEREGEENVPCLLKILMTIPLSNSIPNQGETNCHIYEELKDLIIDGIIKSTAILSYT